MPVVAKSLGAAPESVGAIKWVRYGPGETVPDPQPGDFILTHGKAVVSWIIRVGQGLRYWGEDRKYTRWNHAAIFVDDKGSIIEALGIGVTKRSIGDYDGTEYLAVRVPLVREDREQAAAFADDCRGQPYGYFTIVSIAFALVTGAKFSFAIDGQYICSGLVARALEHGGKIFPYNEQPSHIAPATLAKLYRVQPPPKGTDKGRPPPKLKE